jgi:hypothetical protein
MLSATEVRPERAETVVPANRRLAILLSCLFLLVIFLECFTQVLHDRRRVTLTVEQSIRDAVAIRHLAGVKQVLFAGNSLIFMDVAQPALQKAMGGRYMVHTTGVSGSTYFDWQYGLRALFRRGSQPDVLVFAISPSQFIRDPTVTPMIVSQLWTNHEVFSYRKDQKINLSMSTELLLERYSTFFALRDIVRIYARKVIPGFMDLVGVWGRPTPMKPTENQSPSKTAYMEKLAMLVREVPAGTQFVLLIPPTNQPNDTAAEPFLREAAQELGIPVEEPVGEYQWPSSKFQPDRYHLNYYSAVEYSHIVGADVARLVESKASKAMVAENTRP